MRERAFERIGHLYPQVDLPKEHGSGKATVNRLDLGAHRAESGPGVLGRTGAVGAKFRSLD